MALVRLRGGSAAILTALPLALSCNALWGVDSLRYDGVTAAGSAASGGSDGGSGGAGGSAATGGSGAAAGGGGGECAPEDCGDCSSAACGDDSCTAHWALCQGNAECSALTDCMRDCAPADVGCQSTCIEAHPTAAGAFYQQFECTSCQSADCAQLCGLMCDGGCTAEFTNCTDCINSNCARTVCATANAACTQSTACMNFANCIAACDGDPPCQSTCVDDHAAGVDLYNAVIRCAACTKPACWDLCVTEQANCAGFSAS